VVLSHVTIPAARLHLLILMAYSIWSQPAPSWDALITGGTSNPRSDLLSDAPGADQLDRWSAWRSRSNNGAVFDGARWRWRKHPRGAWIAEMAPALGTGRCRIAAGQ
jgi:hypothetical protein